MTLWKSMRAVAVILICILSVSVSAQDADGDVNALIAVGGAPAAPSYLGPRAVHVIWKPAKLFAFDSAYFCRYRGSPPG
jgi:hypothetical protein